LTAAERERVHEQTLRVLEEVGVCYNTPLAIELLAAHGAEVDRQRLTARIPRKLVAECLKTVPHDVFLAARDPANDRVIGNGSLVFTTDGTATYLIDDVTGERREGTAEDLRAAMCLFDALPEIDYVWPSISPRDCHPATAGLEMAAISIEGCTKHVQDEVRTPDLVAPLLDILQTYAGAPVRERPIYSVINCTIAPLSHDGPMTEAGIALAQAGVPIFILPMVLMGTTGPMSVLGTTIVNMAETLSAVVLYQLAAPGCPLVSGIGSAAAEMRNGLYLCASPEVALINLYGIEMSRFYGLPVQTSCIGADAKTPDYQAGAEAAMTGVTEALAGADSLIAFGLVDGAQSLSLAKTVLDCEVVSMIKRLVRNDVIDDDSALFDDIRAVGIGGHYLAARSTRRRYRAGELWEPRVFRRGSFAVGSGRSLVQDAAEIARHLIATHEVTPVAEDLRLYVRSVIDDFATAKGIVPATH
jgi:trimethylamine--corrinoid protein Co-methyltransferase